MKARSIEVLRRFLFVLSEFVITIVTMTIVIPIGYYVITGVNWWKALDKFEDFILGNKLTEIKPEDIVDTQLFKELAEQNSALMKNVKRKYYERNINS